jgi:membrane protease YdiL (CAAX protease family)
MVSYLPDALWQAIIGTPPEWLFWIKIGLLALVLLISIVWQPIKVVRPFFFLLLMLLLVLESMSWLMETTAYNQWENRVGWVAAMAGFQLLKLTAALVMVAVLLLMKRRWKDFFFTWGLTNAPIKPVNSKKNQGNRSITWGLLGLIMGICIVPLTLLFFGLGNLPTSTIFIKAIPYFPAVLLFAATNAFSEETQYRASLLGDLQNVIGADQAIWLTAVFFGFAHYFGGAPSGILGVLIAGFLGALFAKCMLGSKGIVVPWFIHFCQNAVIYAFWAIGAVS